MGINIMEIVKELKNQKYDKIKIFTKDGITDTNEIKLNEFFNIRKNNLIDAIFFK
jgi:hypothetical protein